MWKHSYANLKLVWYQWAAVGPLRGEALWEKQSTEAGPGRRPWDNSFWFSLVIKVALACRVLPQHARFTRPEAAEVRFPLYCLGEFVLLTQS